MLQYKKFENKIPGSTFTRNTTPSRGGIPFFCVRVNDGER